MNRFEGWKRIPASVDVPPMTDGEKLAAIINNGWTAPVIPLPHRDRNALPGVGRGADVDEAGIEGHLPLGPG